MSRSAMQGPEIGRIRRGGGTERCRLSAFFLTSSLLLACAPIGDDDSNSYSEIIPDENADTPYEQLEDQTVTRMLQEMVKTLDPREGTILRYRFGLDGGSEKTLEEVGEKFGVTRERVRQIQNIALNKLRRMIEKLEAKQK